MSTSHLHEPMLLINIQAEICENDDCTECLKTEKKSLKEPVFILPNEKGSK